MYFIEYVICLSLILYNNWHATTINFVYILEKSVVKCYKCVFPSQSWRELEAQLFERNVAIPVYFAIEDSELEEIRTNLIMAAKKEKTATAVEGER